MNKQEKKSMNSNIDLLKLFSQRNKKNKRIIKKKKVNGFCGTPLRANVFIIRVPERREGYSDKKLI